MEISPVTFADIEVKEWFGRVTLDGRAIVVLQKVTPYSASAVMMFNPPVRELGERLVALNCPVIPILPG